MFCKNCNGIHDWYRVRASFWVMSILTWGVYLITYPLHGKKCKNCGEKF